MINLSENDITRFWSKVERRGDDECWPWLAKSKHRFGYGCLKIKSGKNLVASRVSAFLAYGPPPEGKGNAIHSCDNPSCCNPKHLRWGNQKDNSADAVERGRNSNPPANYPGRHTGKMPRGENLWNQSLTECKVREIWRLHLSGKNITEISDAVDAKKHAVADVCRGRGWRHLADAPSIEELKRGGVRRGYNQFS